MSYLCFNEESAYSEQNASDNEDLRSTILEPFQLEPEQKKMCDNESREKETTEAVVRRKCVRRKSFLKKFSNLTRKHLCWSLFLIKLQS